MNEYNYNSFENRTGFATDGGSPKKPKKHTALKITAFAMSMALVSAGSIGIYSEIDAMRDRSKAAAVEQIDKSAEDVAEEADLILQNVGLINSEEKGGKVMETEDIVDKLLPSVVGIESKFTVTGMSNNNGFFFGFGGSSQPSEYKATGTGTGVVLTEDGYIVTNAHVIYDSENGGGKADSVSVILDDDESYDAEIIGYDTDCDIAVLKIEAKGLTAAEFGDSDSLRLGESVIAIGNPLGFDLKDTVTGGMISGLDRNITINDKAMTLIQTDAAINSGNSGGPLINKYGQVIGINSSKMSSSWGSNEASIEGIGFAIPSNEVSDIVDDIMEYGYVTGKPQLGISCQDVTQSISQMYDMPVGVYVISVTEDSAADKAGLQKGDIITAIDGDEVTTTEELNAKKNKHSAGDKVELTISRDGKEEKVTVTLDEMSNRE
ncbi:serine protease Do [Ruminococcus sp. YRD2003]|uniref:S1C family serine protease n=1 Tax=Ruminococcus sp. YRD2003 TaxID=1452313 RepID=UPI0008B73254|nr:serine protease Do [Ruminococcus flavefaciens]